ncbi:MAG: sigma-70 family RNA polymerase sigma factor [Planctomycetota bacterium]|nr:MAG: sigma-70 family RNA polymerase sigma factor [Planctomycetota bacterium]
MFIYPLSRTAISLNFYRLGANSQVHPDLRRTIPAHHRAPPLQWNHFKTADNIGFMRESESNNASTSHSLLMRLRTNDVQAWKRLSELYGPMVYGWCRAAGLKPEDAADATQNVFQSVFTGFMKFRKERPGDRFRGWLWTITRNRVNDYFRQEKDAPAGRGGSSAHPHTLQWPQNLMPEEQDPETMVTETAQLVRRALELVQAEFEIRTWQACLKTTMDGQSVADVAAELKMTVGAVYVARSRVLKRIREELEGFVEISPDGQLS